MRNLVTIQKVSALKPIAGADFIELAVIMGWQCVVKKGDFKVGDMCVYFEVDSFLPFDDERYEFLHKSSYRNNEYMDDGSGEKGKGLRIKTITLRGEISQGLALPLYAESGVSLFPELTGRNVSVGSNVTELLRVRKWEVPEYTGTWGTRIGDKPYGIPTTDETRLQSMLDYLTAFKGKPYYISTKLDGTSCTVYCVNGKVGVCGRNEEFKEDTVNCGMWSWVISTGLKDRLLALGTNIVLQGEFCGAGIQKNRLKLTRPGLFIFDVIVMHDSGRLTKCGLDGLKSYCDTLQIEHVPIEEVGDSFNYTLDELLEKARGLYASGLDKEGIVIRTQAMESATFTIVKEDGTEGTVVRRMSFKVINNDFLKKEKD